MTINSMTGFATARGETEQARWVWELKSVNGRGLDVRLRLPPGFEGLEARVKPQISKAFARGSISAQLTVDPSASAAAIQIDRDALKLLEAEAMATRDRVGGPPIRAELLLSLRGVIVSADSAHDTRTDAATLDAIAASCSEAVAALAGARADEGAALAPVLRDLVDGIAAATETLQAHPSRSPDVVIARLQKALTRLQENAATWDAQRLHQEAVLLATRADIEEEVQRLGAHIASARALMTAGEPVGRRLDFLAQEFNREANTICSKSNDTDLTATGLELKALIERLREQVQ
ncbi:MAG: YicC/YloC family endoribonuclease, partial [Pseudomonadota bacterium]